jgi:hypothetical protein
MSRRKTNLTCIICGEPIYSDQGFIPGKRPRHAESCQVILKPNQVKVYQTPDEEKFTKFHTTDYNRF